MPENVTDFNRLVKDINDKKILIPDFQRNFVWKEEERQRNIVASVLAKMPIGSILLLSSKPDEYQSKLIGARETIDNDSIEGPTADFLLDGQQRITVLTNVFSDVIHDNCKTASSYISPTLKRRFFLRLPKWDAVYSEGVLDHFNVIDLDFPQNYDEDYPAFLSGDISEFVEIINFTKADGKPYNPASPLDTKLDSFCISYETGYLIPLYLLINPDRKNAIDIRFRDVLKAIADDIGKSIKNHFANLMDDESQCAFIDKIIKDEESRNEIKRFESGAGRILEFEKKLSYKQEMWREQMRRYLDSCLRNLSLNQIKVNASQRARAIDIYENLNRGGVSLSTFDLVKARVAKCNSVSLSERIKREVKRSVKYNAELLPDGIRDTFLFETTPVEDPDNPGKFDRPEYKASLMMGVYEGDKEDPNPKYLDAFLDVLSLYCNRIAKKDLPSSGNKYVLSNIKKNDILALTPEQIDDNCEKVVDALDRALFFFHGRCGLRSIKDFNYNLALVLVATIFIDDNAYNKKRVHNLLEAWYWIVLFAGEFDQDQNQVMIKHLNLISAMIEGSADKSWLENANRDFVFNKANYSDQGLLLMEKTQDGRTPKKVLRAFLCQYLLAKTYLDMFDENKRISVFCKEADTLEAHHIIPLGSVTTYSESSKAIRDDDTHICNSPFNYAFITKKANLEISSDSLDVYIGKVKKQATRVLHIPTFGTDKLNEKEAVHDLLKNRGDFVIGDVKNHISSLLQAWN